jgi:hypothetical protein
MAPEGTRTRRRRRGELGEEASQAEKFKAAAKESEADKREAAFKKWVEKTAKPPKGKSK